MTRETVLTNARIVLDDAVVTGSVLIRDGRIADVGAAPATSSGVIAEDLDGDYLLPGLVELHTDHLESHIQPRPGTNWDPVPAVLAHDAQISGAGVTTVFDAVRIGGMEAQARPVTDLAAQVASAIGYASDAGMTRSEHFIHVRCEVSSPNAVEEFEALAGVGHIRLASLMDHTPGQRQYADVEAFRTYMVGKGHISDERFLPYIEELKQVAAVHSVPNRAEIARRAKERGIALAAHDDATIEHVDESAGFGVLISEFPTTRVAAEEARKRGQLIVMGAPNIMRGGSQSGNVAAAELLAAGLLDILSSDYVPASPLQAVFLLDAEGTLPLVEGAKIVSSNPARAVGLTDRGAIEAGRRADLVRVRTHDLPPSEKRPFGHRVPVVRGVWREGARVS
ncbi:alpha-D-ribose 1-methylphosphonate 5-triphosphate diphosphatase [Gryllotalpicola reticulitermitis]|uniref:Alpha-D-ribose 1-methylphosphonate 5-triphosphate diphosphatase n=1 Tax=Gryllotalpicola reticulitermitis TaxID=1184153 RepID=A0ABV8Q7C3_9MICO